MNVSVGVLMCTHMLYSDTCLKIITLTSSVCYSDDSADELTRKPAGPVLHFANEDRMLILAEINVHFET